MTIQFIKLEKDISNENADFLYDLLSKRKFNISHSKLPTYEEHFKFIESNPYYAWYIVTLNNQKIGSVYINRDNSIGLNLLEDHKENYEEIILQIENFIKPQKEIKSFRSKNIFFNINPNDKYFISILEKLDYVVSKISYRKK